MTRGSEHDPCKKYIEKLNKIEPWANEAMAVIDSIVESDDMPTSQSHREMLRELKRDADGIRSQETTHA